MRFVPNALTRQFGRQILITQKHSPTILFGVGLVGFATTIVLASKATLKLDETLSEIEESKSTAKEVYGDGSHPNYTERDYRRDMGILQVKTVGKLARLYAPAF